VYKSIEITNFRCFEKLSISDLERVNLIVGKNNIGKTALLEALFLHCGSVNPELALRINAFRGIESVKIEFAPWTETPWDSLFYGFDTNKTIEMTGENSVSGQRRLKIKILKKPEELKRLSYSLNTKPAKAEEEPLSYSTRLGSTETAKVIEFSYEQKDFSAKTYMIIDQKGPRIEPFPPVPPFPAFFQASKIKIPNMEEAERLGKLEVQGRLDILIEALKIIEPRLKRIFVRVQGGEPVLHGDIGTGRAIPLPLMGEGMVKLTNIILHIGNAPGGVFLIDEIENGLHHSVLEKVWAVIAEAAREFNVQIFATTHSLECIAAAHEAFSKSKNYDFKLIRLERVDEAIRAVIYDQNTLGIAMSSELEVR
jgi:AAA15 family ATPase/GTPase